MESTNWAPAHSDALRKYFALGMSYAEIARTINAEFNTSYSRCAAIGRGKRLGLAAINRPGEVIAVVSKAQQSSNLHKLGKRHGVIAKWLVPVFESVKMAKLRCVEIDPRHLSLLELEAGDCRYPYGGDEESGAITFCAHPKRKDSNYCTAHFHLTRNPDAVPGRAISTAELRVVEAA
jgi:GcrA cell cycle regulator